MIMKKVSKFLYSLGSMVIGIFLIFLWISSSASSYTSEIFWENSESNISEVQVFSQNDGELISVTDQGTLYVIQVKK